MELLSTLETITKESVFHVLMKDHEDLYFRAIKNDKSITEKHDRLDAFVKEIDKLLVRMYDLGKETRSWDEYKWLTDSIFKWQVVFASTLNIPRQINLPEPPQNLLPKLPAEHALTEAEICYLLDRNSKYLATMQELQEGSLLGISQHDIQKQAEVYLASDILDGQINFASRISSDSYWRLERVWLDDIKRLLAYFLWKSRGCGFDQQSAIDDFLKASSHLRGLLGNLGMKARASEFGEAKAYIESKYLINGKINFRNPEVKILIARKAEQIREKNNCTDDIQNWIEAENYVQMFYENIIPAVTNNDLEKTLVVLKSFQYSNAIENSYHIINAFEVALAIYFLDIKIIHKIWKNSDRKPLSNSSLENFVKLVNSLDGFKIPKGLEKKIEVSKDKIFFKGVMTLVERDKIKKALVLKEHIQLIDELFEKSRLIHKDITL